LSFLQGLPNQKVLVVDMQEIDFVIDKQKFERIIQLLNNDYEKGITNISLK
jgi:hypothetical protein